ncbi:lysylphosphatidylglycerol synthase transmembrane domain-containing protein [Penaeicola halotolerans]|uniref:lysylphosphatidylglycerol synthase transmembrane domain-containing protein n=1 Tax=Penaeicola halotolerans TaxID=2793196 RepID=UPI001CF88634|nr:lysylphosphatidylglycerol synthase transmembrane domain-containing protein [Penaeicola halotolerans]
MKIDNKKVFKTLNPNKVWIPVLIGLGIVFYMFYSDPNITVENLKMVFDGNILIFGLAILVILARDAGYVYRIRTVTDQQLTWTRSIYVIIMWEFASAVTPSVVGGSAVAIFILNKEGISVGKSLAFVMVTAILDNLFFVVFAPLVMLFTLGDIFPDSNSLRLELGNSLQYFFWVSYSLFTAYSLVMSLALFYRPRVFKWFLIKLFSIKFLLKWRHNMVEYGDEIIASSKTLKVKPFGWWMKVILATIFIWSARYLMLNFLIGSFTLLDVQEHLLIFSRQIIMWIVMMLSPTPGSSGTAEFFYAQFFREFLGDYTFVTSILWRMLTYYPYLILGAIFLPRWIRHVYFKKRLGN